MTRVSGRRFAGIDEPEKKKNQISEHGGRDEHRDDHDLLRARDPRRALVLGALAAHAPQPWRVCQGTVGTVPVAS